MKQIAMIKKRKSSCRNVGFNMLNQFFLFLKSFLSNSFYYLLNLFLFFFVKTSFSKIYFVYQTISSRLLSYLSFCRLILLIFFKFDFPQNPYFNVALISIEIFLSFIVF